MSRKGGEGFWERARIAVMTITTTTTRIDEADRSKSLRLIFFVVVVRKSSQASLRSSHSAVAYLCACDDVLGELVHITLLDLQFLQ